MCEFCKDWKNHDNTYGENVYCDICIGKALGEPSLIVKDIRKGCPNGVGCYAKHVAPMVAFAIRYCPNCGEKLSD